MKKLSKDADNWLLEMFIRHGDREFESRPKHGVFECLLDDLIEVRYDPDPLAATWAITPKGIEYIKRLANDKTE